MKRKTKECLSYAALNIVFILLCFITLIPILYAVSVSFSGTGTSLSGDFSFIPSSPSLENYRAILFDEPFLIWLKIRSCSASELLPLLCSVP